MPMTMIPQMGYQNTGSMYGMVSPNVLPHNTMMSGMNMFGSGGSMNGSQVGGVPPSLPPLGGLQHRPMSNFSLATSVNPFAGPSMNPDPSNEELFNALRNYLSTQDLMTVTKK
jgi:chitin synthase